MPTTITFLSDFGPSGGYVAACEAVIESVAPGVRVLHVDHTVPPGNTGVGGRVLARVAPLGPVCVHLAVVDPGVGTGRRAVALHTVRGDYLVGPDNGLLLPAATALGGLQAAWSLDFDRVSQQAGPAERLVLSATFHGRDLFAPAAALLARDVPGGVLGDSLVYEDLVRHQPPVVERLADAVSAEVTEVDRFGNVALAATFAELLSALPPGEVLLSPAGDIGAAHARIVSTFADLAEEELGIIEDSWGTAAIVMNHGSAAEILSLRLGDTVTVSARP